MAAGPLPRAPAPARGAVSWAEGARTGGSESCPAASALPPLKLASLQTSGRESGWATGALAQSGQAVGAAAPRRRAREAWGALGKCSGGCGSDVIWKLAFDSILHFRRLKKPVLLLCVVWAVAWPGQTERSPALAASRVSQGCGAAVRSGERWLQTRQAQPAASTPLPPPVRVGAAGEHSSKELLMHTKTI